MFTSVKQNFYYPFRLFSSMSLAFLLGILLATIFRFEYIPSILILAMLFGIFVLNAFINFLFGNRFLVVVSFWFASLVLGVGYFSHYDYKAKPVIPYDQDLKITGIISKKPDTDWKKQTVVLKVINLVEEDNATAVGTKEIIKISNGRWQVKIPQNCYRSYLLQAKDIYLSVSLSHFPSYHYGEIIQVTGKIEQPKNFSEEFDYINYLKRYHIFGVVNQVKQTTYLGRDTSIGYKSMGLLYLVPDKFESIFNQLLPEPHASLAAGILLGIKKNLPDDFLASLKITGLTHIIALSGFNVTIITMVLTSLLVGLIGRRKTFFLGTLLVILFVLMTGASMSVVRAAIFSLLILLGKTYGRQADQTNIMLLAALIMVLINPYVIRYDLGFQLSFLAFCGLIYFAKPIEGFIERKVIIIRSTLRYGLAETLGAQFAVMPLILSQFGTVSIISPVANILVVWIVQWVMLFSFIAGILGLFFLPLAKLISLLLWPLLHYIIIVTNCLAKLPYANIQF